MTKHLACRGLLAAIFQDAVDIAEEIKNNLIAKGVTSTLEDADCRLQFAAEWFLARIVWIKAASASIIDSELRSILEEEVDKQIEELCAILPQVKSILPDYFTMAFMNVRGKLDPLGLKYGPGPFLVERYSNTVLSLTKERVGEMESMAIVLIGDSVCWQLDGGLQQVLESALNA